jgi:MFS family permease
MAVASSPVRPPAHRRDIFLLFTTRSLRLVAYGGLAVVLALYLAEVGLPEAQIGLLLSLTLAGDLAVSLWLTTRADRFGRRRTLVLGALLMMGAGLLFALTHQFWLLVVAAVVGVISPSGTEIGPFLSIEQAGLAQVVADEKRTKWFAWYALAGSLATASGALLGGSVVAMLQATGWAPLATYRAVLLAYALMGVALGGLFLLLSPAVEPPRRAAAPSGEKRTLQSRSIILSLSMLFALDAFGGAFIVQSMMAYWLHLRFNANPAELGAIFFGANVLAGLSALSAAWLAGKIGLINTMVFTHLPSNVLLMLVPFMPTLEWAVGVLLLRFAISQMDVPTRQSYTMAVVPADERSAASGITNTARSLGAMASPVLGGLLMGVPALMAAPFLLSGAIKIVYDLLLFRRFRAVKPPEEMRG